MAFETLGALIVVDAIARALLMALRLVFVNRPATPQPAWHRLAYSPEARGDTRGTIVLPFREKPEYGLLNFPPDDDGGPEEPPAGVARGRLRDAGQLAAAVPASTGSPVPGARRATTWRRDVRGEPNGGQGRNRTADTVIFSHVLYQLSYLAGGRDTRV
jgi:hypothetical protein